MREFPYTFDNDRIHAVEAKDFSQFIVFAPYIWETYRILKDKNILHLIEDAGEQGITIEEIENEVEISHYGLRVLLEAGLGIGLVYRKENRYRVSKIGHMLLNDNTTLVNDAFMRDLCAVGAPSLYSSIKEQKPVGLSHFGEWNTVYEGLPKLPKQALKSWLAFDHYYSDQTFTEALHYVFKNSPKSILDIGCNTGRWTLQCLNHNTDVKMGLVDLPGQIEMAKREVEQNGFTDRVNYFPGNILSKDFELPKDYEVIWMSQFLDCFNEAQIISILQKCHRASNKETRVIINETFWDRQRFKTSSFILQMVSLYFTTMANGNSQMYESNLFKKLIDKAGFKIVSQRDEVGLNCHTLLELQIK